jgi:outer membrane protein TolC
MKIISFFLLSSVAMSANAITLNQYLDQVQGESSSYNANQEQSAGAALKSREADLYFTPQLFAQAQVGHDGKPTTPPMNMYDKMNSQTYSLGVSEEFSFGLKAKLSYELDKTDFIHPSAMISPSSYWDASPKVELTMPVWGGGFGSTSRANQEVTRQQNMADRYSSGNQAATFVSQAEGAYWKLSAWKDVVRIQESALSAAQNIMDYVSRKKKMNLGEDADVAQAKALVESRTLELQVARNEQKEALRSLNRYRNQPAEAIAEDLEPVNYGALESLNVPSVRPGDRLDVKATEAQLASAKASSTLVYERNRPSLDLYGTYALNGRDSTTNEAMNNTGYDATDTAFVGVKFNMPLNILATSDAKKGALKAEKAAELNHQYAMYSQEQDWIDLTKNLTDARDNLKLLVRIETAQKSKLDLERARLRQGRTTTYQVLMFEQDYSQAALSKVKSAANILAMQSQIKLYQASPEGGK